jgi:threonine/homoserine/homoserine lactone efflux protein
MPTTATLLAFAALAVGMVLTPGPNMIYMISRAITQGRVAGLISLAGVVVGFIFYMLCAAFGITAIVFAVPYAYDAMRFASRKRLFTMGLLTNLFNPKIAIFYLALLPNFIDPTGSVLLQSLTLGALHIVISITLNTIIACAAGSIAGFLAVRPGWLLAQRWVMGTMLGALAVNIALEKSRR